MKRIAIIFEFGTLFGGERSMLAVLDRLADGRFEFVAIAPEHGRLAEALRQHSIQHVPLQLRDRNAERLPRDAACNNLSNAIACCSADLVHANSLSMGRLTGTMSAELSIPCVAHLRDIIKLSKAAVHDLNGNRLLIAVSQATRSFHVDQGLDEAITRVLYNGVDCERFRRRPPTGWLNRELHLPDDCFLAATIGQIGLRKGQDTLAEAAVLAADRAPNIHYLIIGERSSAKQESVEFEVNVARRFQQSGLESRLHILGYRDDVPELMNEVNLLIHPAHQEPFGRVLLEAAASGLPIVATAVGGTTEFLRDGQSASLVSSGHPQALAEAIIELHNDPSMCTRLAHQARTCVLSEFHIDRAASELADVWSHSHSL